MQLDVDTSKVAILADAFGANIKQMKRAEVRALNKTMRWVLKNVVKQVGKEAKVAAKLIHQRVRAFKATTRNRRGRVWAGLKPIAAHRLGKVRQLKRGGVRAGRHKFDDSFVFTSKKGNVTVFQRTGESKRRMKKGRYAGTGVKREPIQRAELEMDTQKIRSILDEYFGQANAKFLELLRVELKYEVFVKNA